LTEARTFLAHSPTMKGTIQGKAALVGGVKGKALRLSGDSRIVYPDLDAINLLGGELSFHVKLDFDPTARNEKTRTVLRNQIFLNLRAPRAVLTEHDGAILSADSLEMMLQADLRQWRFRQFVVSAIGTQTELEWLAKGKPDMAYSPAWQAKTVVKGDRWLGEVYIPFKSLGLNGPRRPE